MQQSPPRRAWLPAIALLALTISACGSEQTSQTAVTSTLPAVQDWTLTEKLAIQTTDLPSGFAAVPAHRSVTPIDVRTCIDSMRATTATKLGDDFIRGNEQVSSQFSTVQTADDAIAIVQEINDPAVQDCLWPQFDQRLLSTLAEGETFEAIQHAPIPDLGSTAAGLRTFGTNKRGETVFTAAAFDFLAVSSGRSVALIFLTWPDGPPPPDLERSLLTAARARATATFAR